MALNLFDMGDYQIVAVQAKVYERMVKDGYAEFHKVVTAVFNEVKDGLITKVSKAIRNNSTITAIRGNRKVNIVKILADAGDADAARIVRIMERMDSALNQNIVKDRSVLNSIASALGINTYYTTRELTQKKVNNAVDRVIEKYPLLKGISELYYGHSFFSDNSNTASITQYVNLINNS